MHGGQTFNPLSNIHQVTAITKRTLLLLLLLQIHFQLDLFLYQPCTEPTHGPNAALLLRGCTGLEISQKEN